MDPPKKIDVAATIVAMILFGGMAVVQLLLASRILPSTIAWGGGRGRAGSEERKEGSQDQNEDYEDEDIDADADTPLWLRIASVIAACILLGMAYLVYARAYLYRYPEKSHKSVKILSWVITGFLGLNFLGNLASTSNFERYVFGSVTLVLCICCIIVSMS
eukprot:CAMPEP_0113313384 /NCGR_PEP_ID=MMETSP0010_2-20120614/9831_1 /TAXON_ID=216773 ORGANISM="Corethron hystrix, Strain 308" /NCGR_SAMPLE_ID=MMETSP0010_2 /ASSEMBLY_ACC=CAM_ASM_000155 /LENGTH=160 /DNA_ID=CAMNT_0000169389 /DNA_START=154 /DNA_END=639 /DNA_ORIENTATION=- /assembly_acc=CAM_ASM_000155